MPKDPIILMGETIPRDPPEIDLAPETLVLLLGLMSMSLHLLDRTLEYVERGLQTLPRK